VQRFTTAREAIEFLIGKITEQAQRAGIALSVIERKMLYFSETDWTLPDISEVETAFESDYDRALYEKKIVKIVRHLRGRERRETTDCDLWNVAIEKLRESDYYLMGMIEEAGAVRRPREDLLKLIASALGICAVLLAVAYFLANR